MRMQFFKVTAGGARLSDSRSSKKIICDAAAGAAAGAIAATFGCPLDVIKTRLQVHGLPEAHHSSPKGSIIITSLQNIIRTEGFQGTVLWPFTNIGGTTSKLGNSAHCLLMCSHYGYTTEEFLGQSNICIFRIIKSLWENNHIRSYLFGAGAGAVTAIAANLPWVVKTRLQVEVSKLESQLENEMKFERKTPFKC
ncbi:unnamed protein product [Camellia sinensis]